MDKERFQELVGALADKEVTNAPCPRCRSSQIPSKGVKHAIVGESYLYLCDGAGGAKSGGTKKGEQPVAVVLIACNQCGYIMTHAQGALGVSPPASSP